MKFEKYQKEVENILKNIKKEYPNYVYSTLALSECVRKIINYYKLKNENNKKNLKNDELKDVFSELIFNLSVLMIEDKIDLKEIAENSLKKRLDYFSSNS
jgi:phosphoribosyl-ATP pyrophosphohydrolase